MAGRFAPGVLAALVALSSLALAMPADPPAGDPLAANVPAPGADMAALLVAANADEQGVDSFWEIRTAPARLDHLERVDADWRARLERTDFEGLPRAGQVDWLLLDTHLKAEAKRRERERARLAELAPLLPFADTIVSLEEARWRVEPIDPEHAANTLDELAKAVKAVRERVERGTKAEKKADTRAKDNEPDAKPGATEGRPDDTDEPADEAPGSGTPDAAVETVEGADAAEPAGDLAAPDDLHVTPVLARRAAQLVSNLQGALNTWYGHYDEFKPDFAWWCEKPKQTLDKELADYGKLLRETIAKQKGEDDDPLIGDPIGRDALVDELAAELVDATPESLIELAEAELSWCTDRMKEAAAELGHGDDWKAALAEVKSQHVPPGEQDALVAAQAHEMLDFLDAHDLVTVPELCRQTWRLRMIDENVQRTLPYAAYGGQVMLVAYPTRDMDQDAKLAALRGNNEHFSRIVTPHELIPGHHLQGYMAQRAATERAPYGTPFLVEGWSLYWELRLWDLGWARGPADRLGMLFWRAHRAARILVSLKFHLGEMTPEQMIDLLVERVGHEKAGATSEVRRYIGDAYGPLYQCAYMVGGFQLAALHDELVTGRGMSERAFHDAVLAQGPIPVALIRAALTTGPLSRAGAQPEPVHRRE